MEKIMMPRILFVLLLTLILLCSSPCHGRKSHKHRKVSKDRRHHLVSQQVLINVDDFGAKADGKSDNAQAFSRAWDKACNSTSSSTIVVPRGKTYYIKHVDFSGPCKNSVSMEIQGTVKAMSEMYDTPKRLWIKFEDVTDMNISGGGIIDGNGEIWWKNSCKIKKTKPCQTQSAPTAMTFKNCVNLKMTNLKLQNAQQMHVVFQDCRDVEASNLRITAPGDSPNTDGIHITKTQNINILDSIIKTGDDCISIVNGTSNVQVQNIMCGPGHGISIGSLGENNMENHVSNILVKSVKITGATNGVRIKTWQGGSGSARNIAFEDILMQNVSNPIIINQNYCDKNKNCVKQNSAVQVENIMYRNIRGTSATKVAVNFNCSESFPCRNLYMENVKLNTHGEDGKAEAFCSQLTMLNAGVNSFPRCSSAHND
ncbi:polygalacturonase-2-like [Primulina tabacum]|uniref:polygalacturonase-2-like n=1 Tax=Primulina tabacum TaxID=48773 RepID=UPI003F5AB4E8